VNPSKRRREDEALPTLQADPFAGERSFNMRKALGEPADPAGQVLIEAERKAGLPFALAIAALSFACELHPFACRDLTAQDAINVLIG
jgi:hypothetical protein